jgi:hypothetical protein
MTSALEKSEREGTRHDVVVAFSFRRTFLLFWCRTVWFCHFTMGLGRNGTRI